jgi:uncharacterized delta-60 repeat protein
MASDLDLTFNNPNGFLTTTFTTPPTLPSEFGVTVSIRSDNRIIMGGYKTTAEILLACFNTDGTFYTPFGVSATGKVMQSPPPGKILISVDDVALMSNDSIIVTGTVMNLASKHEMFVAKFNSLGILDLSFGPSGNGFVITTSSDFNDSNVPGVVFDECNSYSCVIQPNGSIVIVGNVESNQVYLALVRYDALGIPDPSFGTNPNGSGTVFKLFTAIPAENETANAVALQSDGKLVIVGSRYGGSSSDSIVARFNPNGSVDTTTFGTLGVLTIPPFFANSSVLDAIKIDSNGRIIVGGITTNTIGQGYFALACVRTDGTMNPLFGTSGLVTFGLPPTYNIIGSQISTGGYGNRIALQTDDKIVITGGFENTIITTVHGISLARFKTDGILDTTFGVAGVGYIFSDLITPPPPPPFPGPNIEAGWSVAIQSNGKILVGGTAILIDDTYGNSYWILARYIYTPEPPVPIIPICFPAGTPVLTDQGNIFIEKIEPGKNTIRGKEIVAVTKTKSPFNKLVCFERGTLGRNVPNKRTLVSFEHCIVHRNKLVPAYKFVNKMHGIHYVNYTNQYLYNVLLKHHFYMMVNNMMVETLNPTNIMAKLVTSNANETEKTKLICKINEHVQLRMKKMKESSTTLNEMNNHYTVNNRQIYKIHAYHPSFNKFIHTRRIHELQQQQQLLNHTRNSQHYAMKHGAKRVHQFSVRRRMK